MPCWAPRDYYAGAVRRFLTRRRRDVDIFFLGNDLGRPARALLGEAMFRRFILPHLRRLVDLGTRYRLKVMMHCAADSPS